MPVAYRAPFLRPSTRASMLGRKKGPRQEHAPRCHAGLLARGVRLLTCWLGGVEQGEQRNRGEQAQFRDIEQGKRTRTGMRVLLRYLGGWCWSAGAWRRGVVAWLCGGKALAESSTRLVLSSRLGLLAHTA